MRSPAGSSAPPGPGPPPPRYGRFVRGQSRALGDGGYVRKARHPVIWCPKDQAPIGDHDRLEGEGETPVEDTLLKFPLPAGRVLAAAPTRPGTGVGTPDPLNGPAA